MTDRTQQDVLNVYRAFQQKRGHRLAHDTAGEFAQPSSAQATSHETSRLESPLNNAERDVIESYRNYRRRPDDHRDAVIQQVMTAVKDHLEQQRALSIKKGSEKPRSRNTAAAAGRLGTGFWNRLAALIYQPRWQMAAVAATMLLVIGIFSLLPPRQGIPLTLDRVAPALAVNPSTTATLEPQPFSNLGFSAKNNHAAPSFYLGVTITDLKVLAAAGEWEKMLTLLENLQVLPDAPSLNSPLRGLKSALDAGVAQEILAATGDFQRHADALFAAPQNNIYELGKWLEATLLATRLPDAGPLLPQLHEKTRRLAIAGLAELDKIPGAADLIGKLPPPSSLQGAVSARQQRELRSLLQAIKSVLLL